MKIIIVIEYFYNASRPIGGAERQIVKLATDFIRRGIDVAVVTGQWAWGESKNDRVSNIPVHRLFTCWGMFNIKGLRRFGYYIFLCTLFSFLIRRRGEYQVIHCHSAMGSAFVVACVGTLVQRVTVARPMASGPDWGDISRMRKQKSLFGSRWMLNKFKDLDHIVALNRDVVNELESIGVDPDKIVLIPNGVEEGGIGGSIDYECASQLIVVFVGRLHPQKGIDTLLSAMSAVGERDPELNWRLQIVGDGPLRSNLAAQARQLGIEERVVFMGHVADVVSVLASSNLYVLPSHAEGMSNALLEAMSCGLPCIASSISANAEVIRDGENGLLFGVGDAGQLAQAILRLAHEQKLREVLGRAARESVREKYTIQKVADRYVVLYQKLLANAS
jgi:glycosyltransferase involved in cell wall biosynthesis